MKVLRSREENITWTSLKRCIFCNSLLLIEKHDILLDKIEGIVDCLMIPCFVCPECNNSNLIVGEIKY